MPPLVSVVIPTYNCAKYLADAVESVFAQTYAQVECIVVDDGSTDHTSVVIDRLVAKHSTLKTIRKENGGLSSARNVGLRMCSGEFIAFLDADDLLLPDRFARQTALLEARPDIGLVYSDYLVVSENLNPLAFFTAEMPRELDSLDAFCYRNWFNSLVVLIRRSLIDRVGDFDEQLAVAEDWDYWIRCAKLAPIAYRAGAVALYRQHHGQLHRDYARMRQACIQVARKSFGDNRRRLRVALAVIELRYARSLWRNCAVGAGFLALMRYAIRDRFGLHRRRILRQIAAIFQSQFRAIG